MIKQACEEFGECECGGKIVRDFKGVIDTRNDKVGEGVIYICKECGEKYAKYTPKFLVDKIIRRQIKEQENGFK